MRPFTKEVIRLKLKTGAEIGVHLGKNAYQILHGTDVDLLYLIDPYDVFDEPSSGMGKDKDFPKSEIYARALLKPFEARCIWIKKRSEDAEIPPVDFVYIDGSHEYENVRKDIEYFYEVSQSLVGGHDYYSKPGVRRAVDEFVVRHKLKLHTKKPDWWIYK